MITNVSLVTLYVTDQDEAKTFYCDVLGFVEGTDVTMGEGFRWVTVEHPDHPELEVTLMVPGPAAERGDGRRRPPRRSPAGSMGGFGLTTDDCRGEHERLAKLGVEFVQEPAGAPLRRRGRVPRQLRQLARHGRAQAVHPARTSRTPGSQPPRRLEREVAVGDGRGQLLGPRVDDLDAPAGRGARRSGAGRRGRSRRPPRCRRPRRPRARRPSSRAPGRRRRRAARCAGAAGCRAPGRGPRSRPPRRDPSRARRGCAARRGRAPTTASRRMSVSTSRGSSGAMAVTSAGSRSPAVAPSTDARTSRSSASRSTRSPPREASAASSSAVSRAASSRGASPTRPAELRPVSSTTRTWRSRSGRQVRTTSSVERADARQSSERTSSPATYSRSESNSVPWPAHLDRAAAVELAHPRQAGGQVAPGPERREHPHAGRDRAPALARGEPERAERAHRDPHRVPVAAPGGGERGDDPAPLPRRHDEPVAARAPRPPRAPRRRAAPGTARRRPGLATRSATSVDVPRRRVVALAGSCSRSRCRPAPAPRPARRPTASSASTAGHDQHPEQRGQQEAPRPARRGPRAGPGAR